MSDKTSRQCFECCWRQCEASFIDCLMNWQKPPVSSAKQQRVINNTALASVSQPGGPIPLSSFFFFLLFIITFTQSCFFSWKRSIFLITSGLFITNDTLHIALRRYSECWRKWGYASALCSSVLMKREIEGRKAFIFWQNAMPGHEYLLFTVSLSSVWRICWRELVLLERALRESLIWGGESPGGGIHITSDVKKIHYAAKSIKAKGSITSIQSQYNCSAFLFLLLPCVSEVTQCSESLNLRGMLCGNGWGNQTSGCLSGFWTEIK